MKVVTMDSFDDDGNVDLKVVPTDRADLERVPAQEPSAEIARYLERLGQSVSLVIPEEIEKRWEMAITEINESLRSFVRFGAVLVSLKSDLPHGEFLAGLKERHIPQQRASEAMRVANFLLDLEARAGKWVQSKDEPHHSNPRKLLKSLLSGLSQAKLIELARVDPEVLIEAHEQQEFDLTDVDCMSVRMLQEEVLSLRRKRERLTDHIVRQDEELGELRYAQGAAVAGSELPASVTRARSESAALADRALAEISALHQQGIQLLRATDLGPSREEGARQLAEGARAMMLHVGSVLATAAEVYASLTEQLSDWLPPNWEPEHQPEPLTLEEARQLLEWREVHVRRQAHEAILREDQRVREGEIKRGPGRPRGSTKKKKRKRGRPRKKR